MPLAGRSARSRLEPNENDENKSTRITRAKAAALHMDELGLPSKSTLQPKKSIASTNAAGAQRKRPALGDVSNVGKTETVDVKKPSNAKVSLVLKAAHPTGIQKKTSRPVSRSTLGVKENNKTTENKRSGSGAGSLGAGPKRKVSSSTSTTLKAERSISDEVEPVRKKIHTVGAEKPVHSDKSTDHECTKEPFQQHIQESVKESAKEVLKEHVSDAPDDVPRVTDKTRAIISHLEREDMDDPLMVAEYANDIFEYLRDLEVRSIPNPQYMSHQDDLGWKKRGILIDWLIEVHTRFHLLPETLFLAVNIIDRFLSEKVVQLERLQLVGITAMFIASKYEEVLSPHVENFKRITDNGFSEAEILSAERFVLSTLNYDLSYANPMNFLRRVSKADNYDIQSRTIGKYLTEISLLDHRFMAFRPSHCAAGAMYLARLMLDRGDWDETLEYYSGYNEEEVEPVIELMVDYLARPVVHEAFFKKYAGKKFLKASILARQWAKRNASLFGITDTELSLDHIS